jgi:hypothetical protein
MVHTWYGSTMRKSETMSDDLPLPVRPQMPTFSPAAMLKVTPCQRTVTHELRCKTDRPPAEVHNCHHNGGAEGLATDLQHSRQLGTVPHPDAPVGQSSLCRPVVLRPAAKIIEVLGNEQMPVNALRPIWCGKSCGKF